MWNVTERRASGGVKKQKSVLNIFNDTCRCIMRPTHAHHSSTTRRRSAVLHRIAVFMPTYSLNCFLGLLISRPPNVCTRARALCIRVSRWRRSINVFTKFSLRLFISGCHCLCFSTAVLKYRIRRKNVILVGSHHHRRRPTACQTSNTPHSSQNALQSFHKFHSFFFPVFS